MHNEMLQVEGKKMSKSLGNFFTVRDLLDQGVPGEVIRFVMLSTHYRKPMDWTEKKRAEAEKTLSKWVIELSQYDGPSISPASVVAALSEDLNTPLAVAELRKLVKAGSLSELKGGLELLGIRLRDRRIPMEFERSVIRYNPSFDHWLEHSLRSDGLLDSFEETEYLSGLISNLALDWAQFWAAKDFEEGDKRRNELEGLGLTLAVSMDFGTAKIQISLDKQISTFALSELSLQRLAPQILEHCRARAKRLSNEL
jgi:cysteinyl-tRNA synthetase